MPAAILGFDDIGAGELIVVLIAALLVFHWEIDEVVRRWLRRFAG